MALKIKDYLQSLELSPKEVAVYLACLELGESQIIPIAKKVGLPRTTTVYILEQLHEHSIIEIVQKKARRLYVPLPPRSIVTQLKHKKVKLEEQIESMQSALPELNRLYSLTPFQPKVRFYQGQDEIRHIYEEMLAAPVNEIWWVGEVSAINEVLGERYLKNWVKRRTEAQIKTKSIRIRRGEITDPVYSDDKPFLRTIRYAPEGFSSPSQVQIYGDTVVIMTTQKESIGLVITSRDYATTMKNWFTELWKVSTEK